MNIILNIQVQTFLWKRQFLLSKYLEMGLFNYKCSVIYVKTTAKLS